MPYLLDSDLVIDHLLSDPATVSLIDRLAPRGLRMSVVSYMEAFQGIGRGGNPGANALALKRLVNLVPVLDFTATEAERCAQMREELRGKTRRVNSRALDLMIAATAIEHQLILVSRNTRDYRDLPGLELYREP